MSNPKKLPDAPSVIDPNRRYPIPVSSAILSQSIPKTYQDIKRGKLKAFKDGSRTYIHGTELIRRSAPPPDQGVA